MGLQVGGESAGRSFSGGIFLYPAVENIPERNNFYRSLHNSHTRGKGLKITSSASELIKRWK
jgi:hypothetical protein